MKERAIVVGENPGLVGVLTEPADLAAASARPAFVLLNAGLVHRVGPNRLHVRLARELARAGFRAFRVDLSGRGDSDVRRDGLSFLDSSVIEIRAVMDYLGRSGSKQFVLFGICSGAVNALQLAAVDDRVRGCVVIDAPAYPTTGYYVRRYLRRLMSAESWRNTLAGKNATGRWLRGARSSATTAEEDELGNPFGDARVPEREEADRILRQILSQGTHLFFIFSGSWSTYNYTNQIADAFPSVRGQERVRVEYFRRADHTFTRLYHQTMLVERIVGWMSERWNPAAEMSGPDRDSIETALGAK